MKIGAIKGYYNVKGRFEDNSKPKPVVFRGADYPKPTNKANKLNKFL